MANPNIGYLGLVDFVGYPFGIALPTARHGHVAVGGRWHAHMIQALLESERSRKSRSVIRDFQRQREENLLSLKQVREQEEIADRQARIAQGSWAVLLAEI